MNPWDIIGWAIVGGFTFAAFIVAVVIAIHFLTHAAEFIEDAIGNTVFRAKDALRAWEANRYAKRVEEKLRAKSK